MQPLTSSLLFSLIIGSGIAIFSASHTQAADAEFCMQYARDLITMPHHVPNAPKTCHANQPHWNSDKATHIKWCLSTSKTAANKKRYSHNKLVNLCNDTYKLIMLDRKRVATLPLSPNEEMEMKSAPNIIKEALTTGNIDNPYLQLYPETADSSAKTGILSHCDFYSLPLNMDNNPETSEWIVTINNKCLTHREQQPVWLVQQINEHYRVLFQGQHHTITLRYSESDESNNDTHYRNLTITTPLNKQEESTKRCGSITADWHFIEGRYLPFNGKADVHGECLPEYELPDYLQGENTFDLAEGEWKKGMETEEEKRIALYAPHKKALEDYIPAWIKNIEQLVPANAVATSVIKNGTGKNEPQVKQTEDDKGFMENVRNFLGID